MALYPTTPIPASGYQTTEAFKTVLSPVYDSGLMVTRSVRNYPLYGVSMTYPQTTSRSDFQTLYQFFMACKGMGMSFTFKDFLGYDASPVGIAWSNLYVSVGTGSTAIFDLPMFSSSTYKLYVNGVDQASTEYIGGNEPSAGYWKFKAGQGTDGLDQVKFGTAPTVGQLIEWKATGQRGIRARFMDDNLSVSSFYNNFVSAGIKVIEVRS